MSAAGLPNRLAAVCTNAPVPTAIMIAAGFGAIFLPMLIFVPFGQMAPDALRLFLYLGWIFAAPLMVPVLIVAHRFNRNGNNGWAVTIGAAVVIGAVLGVLLDTRENWPWAAMVGGLYGLCFWALAHGGAAWAGRRSNAI